MDAGVGSSIVTKPLLLCLSHLRWDFVFQRPQHLLSLAANDYRVVYFEEPLPAEPGAKSATLDRRKTAAGVLVVTPRLPPHLDPQSIDTAQRELLDALLAELDLPLAVAWYYTPMAAAFAGHLQPDVTVFDVMDELSAFHGASPRLALLERRLFKHADLVFTGGRSLHEAKRRLHPRTHLFPSSVDAAHYRSARSDAVDPADQAGLAHPRIGYFGVVDERIDYDLLDSVAAARPDWQFVMVGPTAKIDPAMLPQRPNLHWLGRKTYDELPSYLAGWNAGLMPFALNEATRFISPTKTPEFLAAGVPVVSTPIPDVVSDWGPSERVKDGLVLIAAEPGDVVAALQKLLDSTCDRVSWLERADQQLSRMSWQMTWAGMRDLIEDVQTGVTLPVATPEGSLVR